MRLGDEKNKITVVDNFANYSKLNTENCKFTVGCTSERTSKIG